MRVAPVLFIVIIGGAFFCSAANLNWTQLKRRLKGPKPQPAAKAIADNWAGRPVDFCQSLEEESWGRIIPLLSVKAIASIRVEEFENSQTACRALAKYLPYFSNREALPRSFCLAVYQLLGTGGGALEIPGVIESIPAGWVEKDGPTIMKLLVSSRPSRLGLFPDSILAIILSNPKGACNFLTVDALKGLGSRMKSHIRPNCVAAMNNLKFMDLSEVTLHLPDNAFALYNGPLSKETIESLSGPQVAAYGSQLGVETFICRLLDLEHVRLQVFHWVTARCLYGYFEREHGKQLGKSWTNVLPAILEEFAPRIKSPWMNIHPNDYIWMDGKVQRIILSSPQVCQSLGLLDLPLEISQKLVGPCLYSLLERSDGGKVELKEFWKHVTAADMKRFTDEMMMRLRNVVVTDFQYILPPVLQVIFDSDVALANLPQPVEEIIISPGANWFHVSPTRFATIAKAAPNLAGQLLVNRKSVDEGIFAKCSTAVLRSLTYKVPGKPKLDWNGVFSVLEHQQKESFRGMLEFLLFKGDDNICSTIKDIDEYLSLGWLRRGLRTDRYSCRPKLSFDLGDVSLLLKAPELVPENLPWEEMLKKYSLEDWGAISTEERFNIILGRKKKFWSTVGVGHHKVILALNRTALSKIDFGSVRQLNGFLTHHPWLIPFLSQDAFSEYRIDQLPCELRLLLPEQLSKLSRHLMYSQGLSVKRNLESKLDEFVGELKALDSAQFVALYRSPSVTLPTSAEEAAVKWHLDGISTRLAKYIPQDGSREEEIGRLDLITKNKLCQEVEYMLGIYEKIPLARYKGVYLGEEIVPLMPIVEGLGLRKRLVQVFYGHSVLKPAIVSFARSAGGLRECLRQTIAEIKPAEKAMELAFDRDTGFDRSGVISLLGAFPQAFADPNAKIVTGDLNDQGGAMRLLVSQILADIKRDLVVSDSQIGSYKFAWGTGQRAGLIVGLVFGKATQMDIRLPFVLHQEFYALLIDTSDGAIEKYYDAVYGPDVAKFEGEVRKLHQSGPTGQSVLLEFLTDPKHLCFSGLSVEAEAQNHNANGLSRTNIWGCREGEGYSNVAQLVGAGLLAGYFSSIRRMVLGEFKSFVRMVVKGLGYTLPPVEGFALTPASVLRPFAEFLPALLNAKPISTNDLLAKVNFSNDDHIESFGDYYVMASKLILAFIRSLDERQLAHLVGVWTGSTTLSLDHVRLDVVFVAPVEETAVIRLDFCKAISPSTASAINRLMLAPGQEYTMFFGKFAKDLMESDREFIPECPEDGLEFYPIRASTCATSLLVYLQSTQQMLNSLVDLLNTPLTAIRDN